ncbi:MAG: EAL domain-containing protein [Coprobacillus sp.]
MMKIKSKKQHNSLFKRVFIPMCILVGVIVCFFIGIVLHYNILGQLNDNSRQLFNQQVTNRSSYIENLMISKWSNITNDVLTIQDKMNELIDNNQISVEDLNESSNQSTLLLSQTANDVIAMMRRHGTSGAYVFFADGKAENEDVLNTAGFYITDSDPESSYEDTNADLLIERSPIKMINQLDIPTNNSWKPKFEFQKNEITNYKKAFKNFQLLSTNPDFSLSDVGYWMPPYEIVGSERKCISYILPLVYNQKVYGAVGVDISFSYLQKLLPYDELTKSSNSGFVLALTEESQTYLPMYINGPSYTQDIKQLESFQTTGKDIEYIDNAIYCKSEKLNLYNTNTPYEDEQWVLMGIIDKDELYSFADHLKDVFMIVFIIVIVLGAVLSYMLSRYIANPIVHLAKYIGKTTNAFSRVNLDRTHIIEVDQLIEAIEKLSNDVLNSASRFTNIIRLANTKLAGFEIDYIKNELFITDKFFDIFLLYDVKTQNITIEEFNKLITTFDQCCIPTQNSNEYIYHVTSQTNDVYLRLRFHKDDKICVGLIEEVTDVIKEKQLIEHERDHDILTGLMNRRAFQRRMKKLFSVDTEQLKVGALVMMDLDNLKEINDKYGHDCGDSYIKEAAAIFEEHTPKNTVVSRTSGDEFYLFFYGYETRKDIEDKLKILSDAIGNSLAHLPNGHDVKVFVSGGVAWYPTDSTHFDELQRFSDYAMYSVKRSIKGRIESFNLSDYENNAFVMKKRSDFHELIKNNMFTYYFQPIVSAKTGEIFGYESLLRSLHPSFNEPKEIITLAKLEGQLSKMELLTWQNALKSYNQFYQEGVVSPSSKIFINSISSQLIPTEDVYELERRTPDILDRVVLEVTEEEESNINTFIEKQAHLKRWNASIALDDYGSGYNSERNLLMVNPDYVKIDIDIIRDIDKDIDKQKIVENIISYCHERNKKVIAEGIETLAELKTVIDLDADYIQGFFFARAEAIPPQVDSKAKEALLGLIKQNNKGKC